MAISTRHPAPAVLAYNRLFYFSSKASHSEGPSLEDSDSGDTDSRKFPGLHHPSRPKYLATSYSFIDGALSGGFLYGQINSLAADSADSLVERTLVAMHAVITHLLSHSTAQVMWIDTEGKFSPVLLKEVIALRLPLSSLETQVTVEDVLNRVQIARVFDFQGIVEIVHELKQKFAFGEFGRAVERTDIGDSGRRGSRRESLKLPRGEDKFGDPCDIGVVVVDTISQPLSELMNVELEEFQKEDEWAEDSEKPESMGLFVTLSRLLSLLAKERHICIIFLNTTSFSPYDGDPFSRWNEVLPSAFATAEERPALGPVYTECVDLSVMITKYPHDPTIMGPLQQRDLEDPQDLDYKQPTSAELAAMIEKMKSAGFKLDNVIEVVGDRNGPSSGMLGAFSVDGMKFIDATEPDVDDDNVDGTPDIFEG